jgi:hypothetical protein
MGTRRSLADPLASAVSRNLIRSMISAIIYPTGTVISTVIPSGRILSSGDCSTETLDC